MLQKQMKQKILIEKIEKRLNFTVVLGMFFPVLIEAIFNLSESSTKEISSIILKTGLIIFILISTYLCFELGKETLTNRQLDYIGWTLLSTITFYGCVFLFLALFANQNIISNTHTVEFVYGFALVASMYLPIVAIIISIISKIKFIISKLSK